MHRWTRMIKLEHVLRGLKKHWYYSSRREYDDAMIMLTQAIRHLKYCRCADVNETIATIWLEDIEYMTHATKTAFKTANSVFRLFF